MRHGHWQGLTTISTALFLPNKLALEDMGKPIGVADYQLIVPKEELQKVLTDEIKAFSEEKGKKKF